MGITLNPFTGQFDITGNSGGGGGSVNSVTASAPLNSTGGSNPNISLSGIVPVANGGTGLSTPGTSGNVLTSNGTAWISSPAAAAGANTALSNLASVAINTVLLPNVNNVRDIGSFSLRFANLNLGGEAIVYNGSNTQSVALNANLTSPSGVTGMRGIYSANTSGASEPLLATTTNLGGVDAVASGQIRLETGNKTAGTGNSGAITLQTGTSSGGTRGIISLNGSSVNVNSTKITNVTDPTNPQDAATKNYVDTFASGANTSLSNLITTSINQDLLPSANNTRSIGSSSLKWSNVFATTVTISSAIVPDLANNRNIGLPGTNFNGVFANQVFGNTINVPGDASKAQGLKATQVGPDSVSYSLVAATEDNQSTNFGIYSGTNNLANTSATGDLFIGSGNKTVGTGNSGSITIRPGTATGTRGKIKFVNGSEGTIGQVWTSTDTAGSGTWSAASGITFGKETFVLSGTDITNQYVDLAQVAKTNSIHFMVDGADNILEGASYDYSVSYTGGAGGKTRLTFLNGIATGGVSALVASDVLQINYAY